jgi:hypothetical protein
MRADERRKVLDNADLDDLLIPADIREGWEMAKKYERDPRILRCLFRIYALGDRWRDTCKAEGLPTHTTVLRHAIKYGMNRRTSDGIIEQQRRIVTLYANEMEKRIVEAPEDLSNRDLQVGMGIAIDKVAKKESWGAEKKQDKAFGDSLLELAKAVREGSVQVEMEVKVKSTLADPMQEAIDVTPPKSSS